MNRLRMVVVVLAALMASVSASLIVGGATASAAPQTVNIANPWHAGQPGQEIDAEIDATHKTVTVLQRGIYDPSRVTVRWVNLFSGKSGTTGLPSLRRNPSPTYPDRYAVLPTGPGDVIISVAGRVPGGTALIPTGSASLGILPPTAILINV